MARAAQYSRGRQIVMHVTLVVVLAATIGLAALVSQSRERSSGVSLSDEPIRAGRIAARLPESWKLATTEDGSIRAREGAGGISAGKRQVVVHHYSVPAGRLAETVLEQFLAKVEGARGRIQPLNVLGRPGAVARFDGIHSISDHPFAASMQVPGWVAAGVVPGEGDAGQDLGVILWVEGYATDGPAGLRLVRQVADALSVIPNATQPTVERAPETRESAGK